MGRRRTGAAINPRIGKLPGCGTAASESAKRPPGKACQPPMKRSFFDRRTQ